MKSVSTVSPPTDFGFYALNSMRMEKAWPAWGSELTVENTAWELNLERFVMLDDRQFSGRDALLKQREAGLIRKFFYAEVGTIDSDIIGGEAVFLDGERIGVAVSGAYGHRAGKSLAFLLLPMDAAPGNGALTVEVLGQQCPVTLLDQPAWDAGNKLPRS